MLQGIAEFIKRVFVVSPVGQDHTVKQVGVGQVRIYCQSFLAGGERLIEFSCEIEGDCTFRLHFGVTRFEEKRFSVLVLLVAVLLKPASAAVREDLAVDQASLDALMAGRSICGDSSRAPEACLDALPCDALDKLIECADGTDPVWTPRKGGSYGGVAAFRAVFPVKAYDHQTAGTLNGR